MQHWPSYMSSEMARGVADCLRQTIDEIVTKPDAFIGEIHFVSERSFEILHNWSGKLSAPKSDLVHDMIHRRCLAQPDAPAINSWDGNFTYREVDELSTRLALYLSQYALGPNTLIPICFEKSRWTTVAMLAVMKTGSAFVLLDVSQPIRRLQEICQTAQASVTVTSEDQASTATKLTQHVVTVGNNVENWTTTGSAHLPLPTPNDLLYAVFTSGSTGKPKGVMIEHQAFATSALAHSAALSIKKNSRVLQLASYAFDISIAESLTTLLVGACICVVSDLERKQSLAQAVARMRADWIVTTSAVARIMDPREFPSLKTMVIGGELVTDKELAIWRDEVDLYLAYGPAECAIFCSGTARVTLETNGRNLGRVFGCRSWVVDPNNHERLVPIGAIGELLLEGPIVSRGYLNEPEKTAAVFIGRPSWLKATGDRPTTLYKTGDLVKYNVNGTLHYISRKDTQVKLRGQRFELGEVEHRTLQCFPQSSDTIVELVAPDDQSRQPFLVAFVCTPTDSSLKSQDVLAPPSPEFRSQAQAAEKALNESLPSYMVPTLYLPIRRLPLNTNGKADRRLLRQLVSDLLQDDLSSYSSPQAAKSPPSNGTEEAVRDICARVLNLDPERIGMEDNFFRLGGDSISAMQVVSHCAKQNLKVKIADIFHHKTIASISRCTTTATASIYSTEVQTENSFDLSPIQQMFFDSAPDGVDHFNQSFLCRINRPVCSEQVLKAANELVARHHMLRARFRKSKHQDYGLNAWQQFIPSAIEGSFRRREHVIDSLESSKSIIQDSHASLRLRDGPVFALDLINTSLDGQFLFMVAHHLVVDLVSWRIILKDLEDLLTSGLMLSQPSLPFQTWCQLQVDYAVEHLSPDQSFAGNIPHPLLDYWDVSDRSNLPKDAIDKGFILDEDVTQALFGTANDAFRTQPVELLQAALQHSFIQTFQDRTPPAIFAEGHGREPWDANNLDLTNTVGWFTTISPTYIKSNNVLDIIRRTKDQRRNLRDNGWAYFTSRYLNPQGRDIFKCNGPVEILFNFTGLYQQLERSDALFSVVNDFHHDILDIADDSPRFALFDVVATTFGSQLKCCFYYNRHAGDIRPVDRWISNYQKSLCDIARILPSKVPTYSLTDFPLMPFDYAALDEFTSTTLARYTLSAQDVEDVYPCSPIQNGMLLSQSRASLVYDNRFLLKITSQVNSIAVNSFSFTRAWGLVVKKHPILRTLFVPSQSTGNYMDQVVLRTVPKNTVTALPSAADPLRILTSHSSDVPTIGAPPYHVTTCSSTGDKLFCLVEVNHSLVDGTSLQILIRDLQRAFDETLSTESGTQYRDYIAYVQSLPIENARNYWQQYLKGTEPCLLPSSNTSTKHRRMEAAVAKLEIGADLRKLCQSLGLTLSNVFQLAWALVLRAYTGSDDVCFGYLTSGRNIPIAGIEDALGPFINMLVCRTKFSGYATIAQLLSSTQDDYLQGNKHQHISLAEIKRSLNLPDIPLFNTILSIQRHGMAAGTTDVASVHIEPIEGEDPTEVRMTYYGHHVPLVLTVE